MLLQSIDHNKVALLGDPHEHKTSNQKALLSACQSMGRLQLNIWGVVIFTCAVVVAKAWLMGRRQIDQTSLRTSMKTFGLLNPKKWLLFLSLLLPSFYQAHAAATLIKEVSSVRGLMQLVENEQLNSFLVFPQEQRQLALNSAWRDTNIEYLTQVGDQTVVVMAYADRSCSSRQALVVVTARRVWGPYQVGGCDNTLIYQRSETKDSFVVLNPNDAMAWVYTAKDERFRGPAIIDLPEQLRQFSITPSAQPPLLPPPVKAQTAQTPHTPQKAVKNSSAGASPPSATRPTAPLARMPITAPSGRQIPAPTRSPKLSAADASVVAENVTKTTKPQRQVVIDLM